MEILGGGSCSLSCQGRGLFGTQRERQEGLRSRWAVLFTMASVKDRKETSNYPYIYIGIFT